MLTERVTWLGARPGARIAARWTTPVTLATRSSIIDSAAIAWPKSVMSARLKRTFGSAGGTTSIEVTSKPCSIRSFTQARPACPLPPVTMIISLLPSRMARSRAGGTTALCGRLGDVEMAILGELLLPGVLRRQHGVLEQDRI